MVHVETVHGYGLRSAQPTPSADATGQLYFVTDEDVLERWSGSAWVPVATNSSGAAPAGRVYLYESFK